MVEPLVQEVIPVEETPVVEEAPVVEGVVREASSEPVLEAQVLQPAVGVAVTARMKVFAPSGQCNTLSPLPGDPGFTAWVGALNTAYTAHGSGGRTCPNAFDPGEQSAIGFTPSDAPDVPLNATFLLGRMTHLNNPIQNSVQISTSQMDIRINSDLLGEFPWTLNETPNDPCDDPGCPDITTFQDTVGNTTLSVGGIDYNLIIVGFTKPQTADCGTEPVGGITSSWTTIEGQTNYGCLWARLGRSAR